MIGLLSTGASAFGASALENMPPKANPQVPRATLPGFPTIGTLQLHMNDGIGNFIQVDRIWNDKGDIVRYYFNAKRVKDNMEESMITVWFLEEYTPQGKELLIQAYKSQGVNTSHLKDLKYKYYQLDLAYADTWGNAYNGPFDYEYFIRPLGEICDSNKKIIAYMAPTIKFLKIDNNHVHYAMLGNKLKNMYNLR